MDRGPTPVPAFAEYTEARYYLTERLGWYCSYCERRLETNLAVEHVAPQSRHSALRLDWNNFLLACVNCNSTKSAKETVGRAYLFPHERNTAHAFTYGPGALIRPNPALTPAEQGAATETLALVGLDEQPPTSIHDPDRRWLRRDEVWRIAEEARDDLTAQDSDRLRTRIVRLALAEGQFSIWMTVFAADADMRRRFIEAFPNTRATCFDGTGACVADLNV